MCPLVDPWRRCGSGWGTRRRPTAQTRSGRATELPAPRRRAGRCPAALPPVSLGAVARPMQPPLRSLAANAPPGPCWARSGRAGQAGRALSRSLRRPPGVEAAYPWREPRLHLGRAGTAALRFGLVGHEQWPERRRQRRGRVRLVSRRAPRESFFFAARSVAVREPAATGPASPHPPHPSEGVMLLYVCNSGCDEEERAGAVRMGGAGWVACTCVQSWGARATALLMLLMEIHDANACCG
jgi:hypothetical protein